MNKTNILDLYLTVLTVLSYFSFRRNRRLRPTGRSAARSWGPQSPGALGWPAGARARCRGPATSFHGRLYKERTVDFLCLRREVECSEARVEPTIHVSGCSNETVSNIIQGTGRKRKETRRIFQSRKRREWGKTEKHLKCMEIKMGQKWKEKTMGKDETSTRKS